MSVKPSAESLAAAAKTASKRGPAPVHLWNPPFCGDLDMRIARDGTWFYNGSPIGRAPLVHLFSSILRKDGDDYFLVTPAEKVGIQVDDAPFVSHEFSVDGAGEDQILTFTNHVGDQAVAGVQNPLRVSIDPETGEPAPYVTMRANLDALIDRKSFYRLVELAVHRDGWFGLWSSGAFFKIAPSQDVV